MFTPSLFLCARGVQPLAHGSDSLDMIDPSVHPSAAVEEPAATRGRHRPSIVGMITNGRAWKNAAIVAQQLATVNTTLPVVVFNTTPLDPSGLAALSALNVDVVSVAPQMPIPDEFAPHLTGGRLPSYHKLALWAQTRYRRIVYLDSDVVVLDKGGLMPLESAHVTLGLGWDPVAFGDNIDLDAGAVLLASKFSSPSKKYPR